MRRGVINAIQNGYQQSLQEQAQELFQSLVQKEQYVGEVFSISYESALVQINDFHRQQVGGIPSLCFLLATRVDLSKEVDYTLEDASVILLRVIDAAPLPNASEAERLRSSMAQEVSGEDVHWEATQDPITNNLLNFAGVKCRVIGTFFVKNNNDDTQVRLQFGSDLSNYYPNRGLKVYKPNGEALRQIVNYRGTQENASDTVRVGVVRYASTDRDFQNVNNVVVDVTPSDLLAQKTALFGMTRTGKSNTTKIILKSVFALRFKGNKQRVGQLVFDPNGEYANENTQDVDAQGNPTAVKNVWRANSDGDSTDVVTYGIQEHPNDKKRTLMLINFYTDLQVGKEIINAELSQHSSEYVKAFRQVRFDQEFDPQDPDYYRLQARQDRRILVYRALLRKAGLKPPQNASIKPDLTKLFSKELLRAMQNSSHSDANNFRYASGVLGNSASSWDALATACDHLRAFVKGKDTGYDAFNAQYIKDHSGEAWADADMLRLLDMYSFGGPKLVGRVSNRHSEKITGDYADQIYEDLKQGRLVIVDQSIGEPEMNRSTAERIMWRIFYGHQEEFGKGGKLADIVIYVEEAHTLLPAGSETDTQNVWARTAKEGAKYHLGMVYATQEVSSIQRNILKNTANWFIGHLNNTDETRELCKYYDFDDFESSIRRSPDKGFMRVRTLSNVFVIPVQIDRFEV